MENEKIYMLYEYTPFDSYLRMASIHKERIENFRKKLIVNYIENNIDESINLNEIQFENYNHIFKIVTVNDVIGEPISINNTMIGHNNIENSNDFLKNVKLQNIKNVLNKFIDNDDLFTNLDNIFLSDIIKLIDIYTEFYYNTIYVSLPSGFKIKFKSSKNYLDFKNYTLINLNYAKKMKKFYPIKYEENKNYYYDRIIKNYKIYKELYKDRI